MTDTTDTTDTPAVDATDDNVVELRPHGAFSDDVGAASATTTGSELEVVLEALLFVSSTPITATDLAAAADATEADVEDTLTAMMVRMSDNTSGIVLERVAGGWAFRASESAHDALARMYEPTANVRLSAAALETLAIVAYVQPISRPDIARVRGVSADAAIANLLDRGLVEEAGRSESGAVQFRTTATFERAFGLASIAALPELESFAPGKDDVDRLRAQLEQMAAARVE